MVSFRSEVIASPFRQAAGLLQSIDCGSPAVIAGNAAATEFEGMSVLAVGRITGSLKIAERPGGRITTRCGGLAVGRQDADCNK